MYHTLKAVLQRVTQASVTINGSETRSIGPGLVILLGVMPGDTEKHSATMANKLCQMRIFSDENGKMNIRTDVRFMNNKRAVK